MPTNTTKAAHYGTLLDEARCEGDWDAIPELVRKIRKHSANRICLTYTAETESSIEKATRNLPATGTATAASSAKGLDAASQLPKLKAVMEEETNFPQDRFQAQVCIGWLYWVVGEYDQAFAHLPHSLEDELGQPAQSPAIGDWTRVCGVKSAYLRANCLARSGKRHESLAVFKEALPGLQATRSHQHSQKQLKYWSELFLTEYTMLYSHSLSQGETSLADPNCLTSFRAWSQYWEGTKGASALGGSGFRGAIPRRRIWYEYYSILSALVEDDLPYPGGHPQGLSESSQRDQLRIELKKAESVYEAILLGETTFPRADEEREEVEEFVQLVMQNWTIMKGRGWAEHDLGQGGKESMSRGVLDILYRASTKTYHSTAILRHLFTVHLAVAEFDLAFKAFDSYLSLVKKGKARVIKTEHDEPSLDEDATVLETVSLCITALCRYGDREAAEKAYDISLQLEQALHELIRTIPENGDETHPPLVSNLVAHPTANEIPPRVIAMSWQAIGTAHAQWARMTYDSASRAEIQAKAVRFLRKSLSAEYGRSANLRGVFSLGLLLAEQRELGTAIELVKSALLSNKQSDADKDLVNGPYWRERSMIPLWHLLALLLSARQDYVMAARACEGAFEQFKDPAVLFGGEQLYRSDHLNDADHNEKSVDTSRGIVDEMDDYEKERIIDIKMTQLALVELMESPRVAVNASLELLSLFARLFGPAQNTKQALPAANVVPGTLDNPRSSTGTLRNSIRSGIFNGKGPEKSSRPLTKQSSVISRPQTTQTVTAAPAIQVTRDPEEIGRSPRAILSGMASDRRSQSNKRQSLHKRDRSSSRHRGVSSSSSHRADNDQSSDFYRPSGGPPVSISRQTSQTRSLDVGEMGVDGVEPSSSLMPLIQFSKEYEKRRRSTILVEIWLMIAGFYRRAKMYDDAKGALAEAQKLVQALEFDVSKDVSGDVSMRDPGWAGKKSVDQLWGDVWSELGLLNLAKEAPYTARSDFESALVHYPDHPVAIVGLSNILLDIYSEKLLPPPSTAKIELEDGSIFPEKTILVNADKADQPTLPWEPLGLVSRPKPVEENDLRENDVGHNIPSINLTNGKQQLLLEAGGCTGGHPSGSGGGGGGNPNAKDALMPSYKATSLPLNDRLASRDRAFGLLTSLTKLGSTWNDSEAWFALARAYEESGQAEKAKEILWWCVELEESAAVRPWGSVTTGGYVL